jgi:hypothetical protein
VRGSAWLQGAAVEAGRWRGPQLPVPAQDTGGPSDVCFTQKHECLQQRQYTSSIALSLINSLQRRAVQPASPLWTALRSFAQLNRAQQSFGGAGRGAPAIGWQHCVISCLVWGAYTTITREHVCRSSGRGPCSTSIWGKRHYQAAYMYIVLGNNWGI